MHPEENAFLSLLSTMEALNPHCYTSGASSWLLQGLLQGPPPGSSRGSSQLQPSRSMHWVGSGARRPSKYITQQLNSTPHSEVPSQPSAAITILGIRFRSRITSLVCLCDRRNNILDPLPTHLIVLRFVPTGEFTESLFMTVIASNPKTRTFFTDVSIKTYWVKVWCLGTGDRDDEKKNSDTYCIIC